MKTFFVSWSDTSSPWMDEWRTESRVVVAENEKIVVDMFSNEKSDNGIHIIEITEQSVFEVKGIFEVKEKEE
jgi:hypothetical protein